MAEYKFLTTDAEIDLWVKNEDAVYEGNVDHLDRSCNVYRMHHEEGEKLKKQLRKEGKVRVWWWP